MMKVLWVLTAVFVTVSSPGLRAQPAAEEIRKLEAAGDTAGARMALARAAQNQPDNIAVLTSYAELLEQYGDPSCRQAYERLLAAVRRSGDLERAATVSRRLAALDLLAGDNDALSRDLEAASLKLPATASARPAGAWPSISIPGPLHSFARMAALSQDSAPDDLLDALARNVVTNGYQASMSSDALDQTEYLKLVHRYLSQARELDKLAGERKVIRIESCDAPDAAELLRILGFRMRGGCGSDVVLETVNAGRAFLTTDSGFPVHELEQALRTNRPFSYDYHSTPAPVLFGPEYWLGPVKGKESADLLDVFLSDPSICRLYLGLSKLDREIAESLRKGVSYQKLKAYAHVLDFFGGMFEIRGGKALVPGGQRSAVAWGELAGTSPDQGAAFFEKLISKDDGWLASLYDALARIRGPVRDYLTDPVRLKRFYTAVRGRITSPGPARPVFRSNTDMMLLTTRLWLEPDGKPHIPGNLDVWKKLFANHPSGKYDIKLSKLAPGWKDPDDVVEALFALCRKSVENEPLKIFMALSDLDRNRATPLQAATVERLARQYKAYGSQYSIFNESGSLADKSILEYLDTAEAINHVRDPLLRSDVAGTYQALIGLWQILVRQGTIPQDRADGVFLEIAGPFAELRSSRELFDAGRNGIKTLLAGGGAQMPAQEGLLGLLAGAASSVDTEARGEVTQDLERILDAQRLVSLDTLFGLADHMEGIAKGEKLNTALVNRLAGRIAEIQLPRTSLSAPEKNALAFGYWTEKHIEAERKLNLRAAIERAGRDAEKLSEARGLLAPLLRDTLVGFNYAGYAPPGAQVLYTNPIFVRSHDFLGMLGNHTWRPTEVFGTGWPSNGGGRLAGSLAELPYALAEAEQNFLIPSQTQALIWGDLVPQILLSATIPRWWNVTPDQLHWVGLHLRYGRELLAQSALDPELRVEVLATLALLAPPARTSAVGRLIEEGAVKNAAGLVTPSELFLLARELAPRRPAGSSCLLATLRRLAETSPATVNYAAISRAFGTPKPTLANSYGPALLNLRTFPALMGYSSRIMAESWESNTLYWAALADEISIPPAQLNVRIPEWTRMLVERIFASHLEDWPALLESLRVVGDDVRAQRRRAADEEKAELRQAPVDK
jgi:hypothetical protein